MNRPKTERYVALDVLRGMTVAGMILVNNPGSWSHIFPPLRHAAWNGCTPTDLVFPFFLFVVGAAMAFSFARYEDSPGLGQPLRKLVRRSLLIFLVGLGLNAFPFYPTSPDPALSAGENYLEYLRHIRIFGVLQRIAMCYFLGGLLVLLLRTPKRIGIALASLLVLHPLLLRLFGGPEWSTLEGNIAGPIDVRLLGESHVYRGYGIPFDPEGLFGALSGSGTVLLGYLCGRLIRQTPDKSEALNRLYTAGLLCLGAGWVLGAWIPVNKPLWSSSYVLFAGGWTILMLAFFIYFIDLRGRERLFTPFKALGMNPLFAFVMAGLFSKTLGRIIRWTETVTLADGSVTEKTVSAASWFYRHVCVALFGNNEYASLAYALIYVAVFTAMAWFLYRRKIIIKL